MRIAIAFDTSRLKQTLDEERARLARTIRRAVNEAAYRARDDIKEAMRQIFDRPTPYVMDGMRVTPARDGPDLGGIEAVIDWAPGGGNKGGISSGRILQAQIEGGQRRVKRFERALGLPNNRSAVPGKWAELDAYGNISAGQIVKILSYLRLFGEQGYTANRSNRASRGVRAGESYFIIRPGTDHHTLSPGVYRVAQEMGGAPLLVIAFVRAAQYRARFAPARIARESVERNMPVIWQQALTRTLPQRSFADRRNQI